MGSFAIHLAQTDGGGVTPLEQRGQRDVKTCRGIPYPGPVTVKNKTQSPEQDVSHYVLSLDVITLLACFPQVLKPLEGQGHAPALVVGVLYGDHPGDGQVWVIVPHLN